ncbi:hypothetical protein [Paratractidigestivibacter sp.]|uniref:hypothetical protein n=1 Tax=Paratractidigestivibacter sp. TaxID=2847316 RepID=UPI002ACB13C1|nr:hypothetical protein [Paratractidigestivibacter sp.]
MEKRSKRQSLATAAVEYAGSVTGAFFDSAPGDRSAAEELLEGVLIAAQKEYEEKKAPYLARLYANILFHPEVSRPAANHLLKLANQLTYRQLVILSNLGYMLQTGSSPLKQEPYRQVRGLENVAIASEIYEMYRMSLIGSSEVALDAAGINPSALSLIGYGAKLFELMELCQLEKDDELVDVQKTVVGFLMGKNLDCSTGEDAGINAGRTKWRNLGQAFGNTRPPPAACRAT